MMKKYRVKQMVFSSSSSIYGDRKKGPFKETDKTDAQVSPYGASKKSGELLCRVYAHLYGMKITVLRLFTVFGPRNRPDMACFLFTDAISQDKTLSQFGDGLTSREIAEKLGRSEAGIQKLRYRKHFVEKVKNEVKTLLEGRDSLLDSIVKLENRQKELSSVITELEKKKLNVELFLKLDGSQLEMVLTTALVRLKI